MLMQEESLESKIALRDKRAADVFWWTLMAMRAVIPLYVVYACNLSLLDFANCRSLFGRRLLALGSRSMSFL
jgi:hypothetical protein